MNFREALSKYAAFQRMYHYRKSIFTQKITIMKLTYKLSDKTFTEKELLSYGYPDVTDDELYQMSLKEEWNKC